MRQAHPIALLAALVTAACVSTPSGTSHFANTSPWIEPSAAMEVQIDDKVQRLPYTSGMERVELIHWFSAAGEPAYETLLELCLDERPEVSGAALAALGATFDQRLVPYLRKLPWPADLPAEVQFERARTYLRLGDWTDLPRMIDGLLAESLYVRAVCAKTLYETTNETFDYDAKASLLAREASVERWRSWWSSRQRDPFLIANEPSKSTLEASSRE